MDSLTSDVSIEKTSKIITTIINGDSFLRTKMEISITNTIFSSAPFVFQLVGVTFGKTGENSVVIGGII